MAVSPKLELARTRGSNSRRWASSAMPMKHITPAMPPTVMAAMTARVKLLGRMDVVERRRPQDGRIKTRAASGQEVELRLSTLRLIGAALKDREIAVRGEPGQTGLDEADVVALLSKMVKQRQESADLYEKGGRPELVAQEKAEIEIISSYLPQQMSDIEAGAAISALLQELKVETMKDMGRAMTALRERFAGKMDFGKASGKIKELLSKK